MPKSRRGRSVVVALRPIARGAVITASDVELQTLESVPTATSRRVPVTSIEELIGMEARQPIAAGEVIFTDQVQAPVLVKRGEIITVVSQVGSIRVRTTARARQDGSRGELVQIESLGNARTYDARVIGLARSGRLCDGSRDASVPIDNRIETAASLMRLTKHSSQESQTSRERQLYACYRSDETLKSNDCVLATLREWLCARRICRRDSVAAAGGTALAQDASLLPVHPSPQQQPGS